MAITEFARFPLKPNIDINDGSTEAGRTWENARKAMKEAEASLSVFWGLRVEQPESADVLIDWESVAAHQAFSEAESSIELVKSLRTLLSSPSEFHYVDFTKPSVFHESPVASAPVVEFLDAYVPANDDAAIYAFDKAWTEFAKVLQDHAEGFKGWIGGWVVGEVPSDKVESGTARKYIAGIGWESIDAHMTYRETEAFKVTIKEVRNAAKALSVVRFTLQLAWGASSTNF